MTVILLIRQLAIGGAERQVVSLARELKVMNFDVRVAVFYDGGVLESELIKSGIPIIFLQKSGRSDIHSFALNFLRVIRKHRPSIIYSFLTGPNLCALIARLRFPHQTIFWGIRASANDRILRQNDLVVRFSYWLSMRLAALPDLIITNSESSKASLIAQGVRPQQIAIVNNGVDLNRFRRDPKKRLSFRASLGIDESTLLIGMVARIDPVKDHGTFIAGVEEFLQEYPHTVFLVIGDGDPEYVAQLKKLSSKYPIAGSLIWAGEQQDMVSVYNALDVNSLTSTSESFPNALVEAMACGVLCVSSDVGDAKLIIEDPNLIFQVGDVHALVQAWKYALAVRAGPNFSLSHTVNRVRSRYSQQKMAADTVHLFPQI